MNHQGQERTKTELPSGMTLARITKNNLHFEILVNMDDALKFKRGGSDYLIVEGDKIFTNLRKGDLASKSDLEIAFGTTNVDEIGKEIVRKGDILIDSAHRNEEQEKKFKQVVDFLATNSVDPQTGNPHSRERIKNALEQAHVNIKNVPVENQIKEIIDQISSIIPIKVETKKIKITIPATKTGQVYGLVAQYKEKENWLNNGDLEVIVNIPAGISMDFYDKLNSMTHGSAVTEELKED
jgi:ribosome maturation protein SDO1